MTTRPLMAFFNSVMDDTMDDNSLLNFTISCLRTMANDGNSPLSCESQTRSIDYFVIQREDAREGATGTSGDHKIKRTMSSAHFSLQNRTHAVCASNAAILPTTPRTRPGVTLSL